MNMTGKKFALCGYPPLAEQVKNELAKIGAECNYFVNFKTVFEECLFE